MENSAAFFASVSALWMNSISFSGTPAATSFLRISSYTLKLPSFFGVERSQNKSWVRGKVLDVDQAGSAQTTALALDEVDVLQFPEQLDRFMLGAAEGLLHLPDGVDDIHPPLLVQPAVLDRQAHAVQQDTVQCPGIGGELPETAVLKECFRNTEVGKQLARLTVEVVVAHSINGSSTHGLRHLSYT